MSFESRFNTLLAATVVLSIAGFFTAERDVGFGAVAVGLSIAAWRLTRPPIGVKLPRGLVTGAVSLAVLYALFDAAANGAAVSSVCRLIAVIQVIKFFDPRSARDSAQRILLAIFLAIGAVLTSNQLSMGAFAAAFLPLSITTVIHYQIFAGAERAAAERAAVGLPSVAAKELHRVDRAQVRRVWVASTLGVLVLAAGVFVMMPRGIGANSLGNWGRPSSGAVTGFSDQVQLGRAGFLSESSRIVLDLVVQEADGTPLGGEGNTHHLRGAVLDSYDPQRGVWYRTQASISDGNISPGLAYTLANAPANRALIHETITLRGAEGNAFSHLFASWKPITITFEDNSDLRYGPEDGQLLRRGSPGALRYTVASLPTNAAGVATRRSPATFVNPAVSSLAQRILREAGIDPSPLTRPVSSDSAAARAIESYLRANYEYTLEMVAPTDGQDPIEFFLEKTRRGHCEYFASAMAALCRSVGVPARVITGYLASEYDASNRRYIVRENDAHAWVEAEAGVGRWRVYDPTPPGAIEELRQASSGIMARIRRAYDSIGYAWINSVVAYDGRSTRSQSTISLGPVADYLRRVSSSIRSRGAGGLAGAAGRAVIAFAAAAAVGYAGWFAWWLARRGSARSNPARASWSLYADYLALSKRRGVPKPAWQPPLEHARDLAGDDPEFGGFALRLVGIFYASRFGGSVLDRDTEAAIRRELRAWRSRA